MSVASLIGKLARGEPLSNLEATSLELAIAQMEGTSRVQQGWIQPGTTLPIFLPSMETINHQSLASPISSIECDVNGNYKHLFIIGSGRSSAVAANDLVLMQFNGDTGANYDAANDGQVNGADSVTQSLAQTYCNLGTIAAANAAAGASGSFFAFIPHFRSALWKGALCITGARLTNAFNIASALHYSTWKSTEPIKSVKIYLSAGNFDVNSEISIHGVQ